MKLYLVLIVSVILFSQCGGNTDEVNLIEEGTMMNSPAQDTCSCDDLALDSLGVFTNNDTLYTGVCVLTYPGTDMKYVVKGIMNGALHGAVTYYDKAGNVLVTETYQDGRKKRTGDGAPLDCDCTELDIKSSPGESITRSFLDDIPFTGKCNEKYPESNQVYMEVDYKSGLLDGYSVFYDKAGNTMYMERYEKGELLKVIYD